MDFKGFKPRKGHFGFKEQKAKKKQVVYGQAALRWSSGVVNYCNTAGVVKVYCNTVNVIFKC